MYLQSFMFVHPVEYIAIQPSTIHFPLEAVPDPDIVTFLQNVPYLNDIFNKYKKGMIAFCIALKPLTCPL